jgi:nucleotide-binding universal stress UspA family protein
MKFLIGVEGSQAADEAARLGAELARLAGAEVARLRVVETPREAGRHPQTGSLLRVGNPAAEILAEAAQGNFDLLVVAQHARPRLAEMFTGSTAARLARQSPIPLLIVKSELQVAALPIKKILVCTGGETPGEHCAHWGGRLAAWTGASLTILHVMSQIAFGDKSKLDDLVDSADDAMQRHTREGAHLEKTLTLARDAGAWAEVRAKIRRGLVLDEILAEIKIGNYDLVVIGAHAAPDDRPTADLVLADVTHQLVVQCPKNILVVRAKR